MKHKNLTWQYRWVPGYCAPTSSRKEIGRKGAPHQQPFNVQPKPNKKRHPSAIKYRTL